MKFLFFVTKSSEFSYEIWSFRLVNVKNQRRSYYQPAAAAPTGWQRFAVAPPRRWRPIPFYTSSLRWHNERCESIVFPCCTYAHVCPALVDILRRPFVTVLQGVFMTLWCVWKFWCFSCTPDCPLHFIIYFWCSYLRLQSLVDLARAYACTRNFQVVDVLPGQAAVSAGVKAVSQSGLRVTIEVKSKCHGLPQQSKSRTLEQCVCFRFNKILDMLFFCWQGLWIWHCKDWTCKSSLTFENLHPSCQAPC